MVISAEQHRSTIGSNYIPYKSIIKSVTFPKVSTIPIMPYRINKLFPRKLKYKFLILIIILSIISTHCENNIIGSKIPLKKTS